MIDKNALKDVYRHNVISAMNRSFHAEKYPFALYYSKVRKGVYKYNCRFFVMDKHVGISSITNSVAGAAGHKVNSKGFVVTSDPDVLVRNLSEDIYGDDRIRAIDLDSYI